MPRIHVYFWVAYASYVDGKEGVFRWDAKAPTVGPGGFVGTIGKSSALRQALVMTGL